MVQDGGERLFDMRCLLWIVSKDDNELWESGAHLNWNATKLCRRDPRCHSQSAQNSKHVPYYFFTLRSALYMSRHTYGQAHMDKKSLEPKNNKLLQSTVTVGKIMSKNKNHACRLLSTVGEDSLTNATSMARLTPD